MGVTLQTPWAILLCKFSDDASEPHPRDFYEQLFTTAGAGSLNMIDFFHAVSHASVDLSGSRVFGWLTLDQRRSDYKGSGLNWQGRQDLVDWAKQKATASGVDLSQFFGVVVSMNVSTDLFGGGGRQAVCDNGSLQPSILGQEMGHGYGLDHSRIDGSMADYQDRWDVMSTWNSAFMASDPKWDLVGPGLNVWNMRGRGWLDETRVWKGSTEGFNAIVELRPLHRKDLPGLLAAELPGGYLVEYRTPEVWDAAIPRAAVLVHRFQGNHSYIMRGTAGNPDLVAGDAFEWGDPLQLWRDYLRLEVSSIDAAARNATLSLNYRRGAGWPELSLQVLGGVSVDGSGWVIVGGRIIRIPPWNPLIRVLEEIAAFESATTISSSEVARIVQRTALEKIAEHVQNELGGVQRISTPAPREAENRG
jgi:hypothetical protein